MATTWRAMKPCAEGPSAVRRRDGGSRRGVAAWLRAAEAITVAAAPSRPTGEVPVADGDELVGVLASMALACLRGG